MTRELGKYLKTKIAQFFGNKLFKKGLNDSFYYLIANIGNKLLALLVIPFLAKSVGVEEFATYDLFLVTSNFLNILVILGIDSGVAIFLAENRNRDRVSFLYISTILISISLVGIISIVIYNIFLYTNQLFTLNRTVWMYICIYLLFGVINYHTFNFLRWEERAKEASFINLFSYIAGMLIGLFFLYFIDNRVESYLHGLIIGIFLGTLLSLYISREYIFGFSIIENPLGLLKELLKVSLPFIPNYLGNNLIQIADRVVILMLFGKYELGVYAIVVKLARVPQIIIGTVSSGFLPVMIRNYKSKKGASLIRSFFHSYLLMILILFILSSIYAKPIMMLFAGEKYVEFAYLFPLALVAILFVQSSRASGFGFIIQKKTKYIMYITFISVIINYILSLLFGYYMGLEGVIFGTLLTGIFKTYIYINYSERLYRFNYNIKLLYAVSLLTVILTLLKGDF